MTSEVQGLGGGVGEEGAGGSEVTEGSGPNDWKEKEASSRGTEAWGKEPVWGDGEPRRGLESHLPEDVRQAGKGGGWAPEEELSVPGTHPLLTHSCRSCSLRGLLAFAVTGGSVPAWWAALPASCCPLGPRTAAPPVPVSLGIWDMGEGIGHPQSDARRTTGPAPALS